MEKIKQPERLKRQRDLRTFFPTQKTPLPTDLSEEIVKKSIDTIPPSFTPLKSEKELVATVENTISRQEAESMLRKFDLKHEFGPCVGMSRLERWRRAERLGKNPPTIIRDILLNPEFSKQQDLQKHLWYQESFCSFQQ